MRELRAVLSITITAAILFTILLVPASESKPQSDFESGYGYGYRKVEVCHILMRDRIQAEGPNMNRLLLGWLRPVLERKGDSIQRLLPSSPTPILFNRICPKVDRNSRNGIS